MLVSHLPFAFRLERTNFMAKGDDNERPSVDAMLGSLRAALADAGIDELDFRNGDCVVSVLDIQRVQMYYDIFLVVHGLTVSVVYLVIFSVFIICVC